MRTSVVALLVVLAACAPKTPAPPRAPAAPAHPPAESARKATALRVDHAWVKDATGAEQAKRRKAMETLRAKVANGGSFVESWYALGLDGRAWHVAEQETYDYSVVPAEARDLPVGSLSPIIPGNGGLHLFRILGRE
jgi:hypothetical protein